MQCCTHPFRLHSANPPTQSCALPHMPFTKCTLPCESTWPDATWMQHRQPAPIDPPHPTHLLPPSPYTRTRQTLMQNNLLCNICLFPLSTSSQSAQPPSSNPVHVICYIMHLHKDPHGLARLPMQNSSKTQLPQHPPRQLPPRTLTDCHRSAKLTPKNNSTSTAHPVQLTSSTSR